MKRGKLFGLYPILIRKRLKNLFLLSKISRGVNPLTTVLAITKKCKGSLVALGSSFGMTAQNLPGTVKRSLEKIYKFYHFHRRNKFRRIRRDLKNYLKHHTLHIISHRQLRAMLAVLLVVVILVNVFQPTPGQIAQGATYTFVQSDWSGGASSTASMVHPTNQTGWNKFSTSTNTFTTGTTTVTIASTTYSSTDDGTFTSTGSATGGGFSNGTTSTITISGSGASANMTLSVSASAETHVTSSLASVPITVDSPGRTLWNGSDDYIYEMPANILGSAVLYRYSISGNAWSTRASIPVTGGATGEGLDMIRTNNEDYIYAISGNGGSLFSRYSITNNTWTALSSTPAVPAIGSKLIRNGSEDYIYFIRSSNSTAFYRYSISGDSWSAMASMPGILSQYYNDTQALRFDGDNFIYVADASNNGIFYRYSISGNSWTTLSSGGNGMSLIRDGSSDYFYGLEIQYGGSPVNMMRYSSSSNSWTTLAAVSGLTDSSGGATLIRDGSSDYIYANGGNNRLYRYSISGDSWVTITSTVGATLSSRNGSYMLRASGGNIIYIIAGIGSTSFIQDVVNSIVYSSSGNFTSATMDLGVAKMNSLSWTSTTPSGVGSNSVKFQLAANNDNSTWSYIGPDGTSGTYFTTNGGTTFPSALQGNLRYWRYKAYLSTADTSVTPTLSDVTFAYSSYLATSSLISSVYDTVDPTNVLYSVAWNPSSLPTSTTIKFQLRSASTSTTISSATWMGPDGTASSYFTTYTGEVTTSTMRDGSDDRYFQYQAFLATTNPALTPTLASVTVTYVVNASPEVQSATSTPNSDGTVTITYQTRDSDSNSGSVNPGYVSTTFQYCANATTTGCVSITAFPAGTGINNAVATSTWTSYTATWTPAVDLGSIYDSNAVIKVIVNDNEAANNTANTTSVAFILDTRSPTTTATTSLFVDASVVPALITLSSTDHSAISYKLSLNSDLSGASFVDYASTTTLSLATNPDTVYVQYRDAYGNTTTIVSATTPESPTSTMVQDTSNVPIGEYRLFLAWQTVSAPATGFGSYKVYRSTDQSNWSLLYTITDRATNYYGDNSVTSGTLYYYKVVTVDTPGNVSYASTISGRANGTQDAQEGGGGTSTDAPTITNVATSSLSSNSVTITWDTDQLSNSVVGYSTTAGNFTDNTITVSSMVNNSASIGQHAAALVGLAPNTTYYFQVKSVNVDNVSSTSPTATSSDGYMFTTPNGTTISGVANTDVSNSRATITWNTTNNATSWIVYSTSSNFAYSITTGTADSVTSHSVVVTDLSAATHYYYYVYSVYNGITTTDKNIINGDVEYYRFTTTNDSSAPTITNIAESLLVNTSTITWTTNKSADSQIIYGTTTAYGSTTTLDSTMTVQHSVTISGLSANTLYHYKIRSTDANSNLGQSADRTFTTEAQADATAPVISNIATSSVSLTGATITWTTDENANHLVDYGPSSGYGYLAGDASDYSGTSHSVSLTNLTGNTLYYFRVSSQDATGNTVTSSQYTFTTVPDTTAPTISNVTTAVVNQESAVITWTTSEAATSDVNYGTSTSSLSYINTTSTLVTNHSVTLTGLTLNTTYYYKVTSADSSNNIASSTNSGAYYSFTTLETPGDTILIGGSSGGARTDRTPPVVSNIAITDVGSERATVTWTTDEISNSFVKYGGTETYEKIVGNVKEDSITQHNVYLSNLSPASIYHLKAVSYDSSGNKGESSDQTFSTLNIDGTVPSSTEPAITNEDDSFVLAKIKLASQDMINKILDALALNPFLKDVPEASFIKALTEMTDKVVAAPEIVGIKPQVEVQGTTAFITWSTDKKSSSAVSYAKESEYKPSDSIPYSTTAVNPEEFNTTHHVELSGLDPATTYHFQVASKGLIGPEAKSKDYIFKTTSALPIISDIKVQKAKESNITVSWKTNIPTAAILEYTNQKNKITLSQGDTTLLINHEFTLKNLEGATDYMLVLKATDEFDNKVSSLPIKFSTLIDQLPPVITKLSSDSTLYPGKDSKVQTIISWETDEPATSQLFYQEGVQTTDKVIALPVDTALNTRHIIVITKFSPGSVYKFWVESKDLSGNSSKSETFSLLAPQAKETIVDIIIKNFESVFGWTKNVGI